MLLHKLMHIDQSYKLQKRRFIIVIAKSLLIIAVMASVCVMLSWITRTPALMGPIVFGTTQKFNTALCIFLLAISNLLLTDNKHRYAKTISYILATISFCFVSLTLIQYLFGLNLGIDELFAKDYLASAVDLPPGRPGPNTAAVILLAALGAMITSDAIAVLLSALAGWLSILSLAGYAYGFPYLYVLANFTQMALSSAISLLVLSTGIILVRSSTGPIAIIHSDGPGGKVARFLLPLAVVFPFVGLFGDFGHSTTSDLLVLVVLLSVIFPLIILYLTNKIETEWQRRFASFKATKLLSESANLEEAVPKLLQIVCESINWSAGELWLLDQSTQKLHCVKTWTKPEKELTSFAHRTNYFTFKMGEGLPGRIWKEKKSIWINDVLADKEFLRKSIACQASLHSAFGFPVINQGEIFGVMIFFSHQIMGPQSDILDLFANTGTQLGQFIREKETTTSLQEQAELLNLTHDTIMVRDLDGTIRYWNRGAREMYGYTSDEALGKKSHNVLQTESPLSLGEIENTILTKKRWEGELIHRSKDGRRIIVASRQALKTNKFGEPVGVLEINNEITEYKHAQERLLLLTEELKKSNTELAQFATVVSHDLQEPLRGIAGSLELIEEMYKDKISEKGNILIAHAVESANHMHSLITDVLSLSRISSKKEISQLTDLSDTVQRAVKNLDAAIKESQAKITWNKLPTIFVDRTQFLQLFQNLISNAIKFRSNMPPEIHITVKQQNSEWLFEIRDNGIGFNQEYSQRIFLPFKRLHSRDKFKGTGIGLAICKRIVEKHRGRIWVESSVGSGSSFYFTIPVQPNNQQEETIYARPQTCAR